MSDKQHPSISVFGSINIDMTSRVAQLPKAGETIHASSFTMGLGGKGANQAVAASRLGLPVALAGWIGDDALGRFARQHLEATALNIDGVYTNASEMTGIASININVKGDNTIVVAGGTNMAITADDVDRVAAVVAKSSVLMMQLEVPMAAVLRAAALARNAGAIVMLDPAPAPETLPVALYQLAHIMTPNETETEKLTGIRPIDAKTARSAADILMQRGLQTAIIKLGGEGVCYFSQNEAGFMPPFKVAVVDSVAAGDSFNGGLATGLAQGLSLSQSVRLAAACGALATTKKGASDAAPNFAEASALLQSQPDVTARGII